MLDINQQSQVSYQDIEPLSSLKNKRASSLYIQDPFELSWQNLSVWVTMKELQNTQKLLLNNLSGAFSPYKLTAILGPSGSGKTTLLNFLSGRLYSQNMKFEGQIFINNYEIDSIEKYANQMSYVMQDDILLSTFTPKEIFQFHAKLKLGKRREKDRERIVEELIEELGLERCQNTMIGNSLQKGVSGGERKRTSIGVELIGNPKIIFLDEPTTGLDSDTALHIIDLLKKLTSKGMNIISTIHQPSSMLFERFDNLLLLVQGNIIYQGPLQDSLQYFGDIGYQCPFMFNPADYFMKIMSEQPQDDDNMLSKSQIKEQFQQRIQFFVQKNNEKQFQKTIIETKNPPEIIQQGKYAEDSFIKIFIMLFNRNIQGYFRELNRLILQIFQTVFISLITIVVYSNLSENLEGFQNRKGITFFMSTNQAFLAVFGSIYVFFQQKQVYLRERASNLYSPNVYFWAKSLSELPFQFIHPIIMCSIIYFAIGMNDESVSKFFLAILTLLSVNWYSSSYGFLVSIFLPKFEVAMGLVPAIIIPFMILSGFFMSLESMPIFWRGLAYLSMFKYGFQALCTNEFDGNKYYPCNQQEICPLKILDFDLDFWENIIVLFSLGILVRIICIWGLFFISNVKRPIVGKITNNK